MSAAVFGLEVTADMVRYSDIRLLDNRCLVSEANEVAFTVAVAVAVALESFFEFEVKSGQQRKRFVSCAAMFNLVNRTSAQKCQSASVAEND